MRLVYGMPTRRFSPMDSSTHLPEDPIREAKEKIAGWLRDEEWLVTEQSSPDAHWVLNARKDGPPLIVVQPKGSLDCVALRYELDLGDIHTKINGLSKADKTQFVWDLH